MSSETDEIIKQLDQLDQLKDYEVLLLDLDGVLITTPPWKADEIHTDGYSCFNDICVQNLNRLLTHCHFDIWLTSTRRTVKTIAEFNQIFKNRGIKGEIKGFIPTYADCSNRREEILTFLSEFPISNFLIIDDDKSLNDLKDESKKHLISTELMQGFTAEKLEEAVEKLRAL